MSFKTPKIEPKTEESGKPDFYMSLFNSITGNNLKIDTTKTTFVNQKGLLGKRVRDQQDGNIVSKVESIPQEDIITFDDAKEERKGDLPLSVKQRYALPTGVKRILEGVRSKQKEAAKGTNPEAKQKKDEKIEDIEMDPKRKNKWKDLYGSASA